MYVMINYDRDNNNAGRASGLLAKFCNELI